MRRTWKHFILIIPFIAFCVGSVLGGCGPKLPPDRAAMQAEYQGAPDWVVKGCNSYWKAATEKPMICGVGVSDGSRNPAMAHASAALRARADIAKKIRVTVTSILKDYQASTTGGGHYGSDADDEQHVESITREITEISLPGTEVVDSWISENGTYYVLVVLSMDRFKDSVQTINDLSETMKSHLLEKANKSFDDLEKNVEGASP